MSYIETVPDRCKL